MQKPGETDSSVSFHKVIYGPSWLDGSGKKSLQSNRFLFHVMLKDSLLQDSNSICKKIQYFVLIYIWQNFELPYPCGEWHYHCFSILLFITKAQDKTNYSSLFHQTMCLKFSTWEALLKLSPTPALVQNIWQDIIIVGVQRL